MHSGSDAVALVRDTNLFSTWHPLPCRHPIPLPALPSGYLVKAAHLDRPADILDGKIGNCSIQRSLGTPGSRGQPFDRSRFLAGTLASLAGRARDQATYPAGASGYAGAGAVRGAFPIAPTGRRVPSLGNSLVFMRTHPPPSICAQSASKKRA
jgi:hypothetical protein